MLTIRLNGETKNVQENTTIADLLAGIGMGSEAVAVEVNRTVVSKAAHPSRIIQENDVVEIVTVVGGG